MLCWNSDYYLRNVKNLKNQEDKEAFFFNKTITEWCGNYFKKGIVENIKFVYFIFLV